MGGIPPRLVGLPVSNSTELNFPEAVGTKDCQTNVPPVGTEPVGKIKSGVALFEVSSFPAPSTKFLYPEIDAANLAPVTAPSANFIVVILPSETPPELI